MYFSVCPEAGSGVEISAVCGEGVSGSEISLVYGEGVSGTYACSVDRVFQAQK